MQQQEIKTAQEIFADLGYEKTYQSSQTILYQHLHNEKLFVKFNLFALMVMVYRTQNSITGIDTMARYVDSSELKAINKQIEELGWRK